MFLLLQCGHAGTVVLLSDPSRSVIENHLQFVGRRGREKLPNPQPWLPGPLSLLSPFAGNSMHRPKPKLFSFAHSCKFPTVVCPTRATASRNAQLEQSDTPPSSPQLRHENEANRRCVLN